MDDIDEVLRAAGHWRFSEPGGHPVLNPLSALPEPRRHIKTALKERIRVLVGAYISLCTFVEDEEALAPVPETYRRVMNRMDEYEKEIKDYLKELAN